MSSATSKRRLITGLLFIGPNILGFLAFVLFPLVYSMVLAFSNWDLRLHNMFQDERIRFTGFDNFVRLLTHPEFWVYLGNTLFLMIMMPFAMAGSLIAAILLNQNLQGKTHREFRMLLAGAVLVAAAIFLTALGLGASAFLLMLSGLVGLFLIGGVIGGNTVYRTLFYTPHFTAGVATFILWKKLYSPETGPINNVLSPVLDRVGGFVQALPSGAGTVTSFALLVGVLAAFWMGLRFLRRSLEEGELKPATLVIPLVLLVLPVIFSSQWIPYRPGVWLLVGGAAAVIVWHLVRFLVSRTEPNPMATSLSGTALILSLGLMSLQFCLIGLGIVCFNLPAMAADGLEPPKWIADYHWAKPSLMLMAMWAAVGSNSMILYLAGLNNVPPELYEASSIDGASRFQTFWNVTWPQLAPVTFFIFVMGVIGGLQGGFEMARTMTQGGPAGATTTLSYYVYNEGFVTGELGFAAAVAWTLFLLVFLVTLFNWRFGTAYANE